MLGMNVFDLRHSRRYEEIKQKGTAAIRAYVEDVTVGSFPGTENVRHLTDEENGKFMKQLRNANDALQTDARTSRR